VLRGLEPAQRDEHDHIRLAEWPHRRAVAHDPVNWEGNYSARSIDNECVCEGRSERVGIPGVGGSAFGFSAGKRNRQSERRIASDCSCHPRQPAQTSIDQR
jgi:hypothetical protein